MCFLIKKTYHSEELGGIILHASVCVFAFKSTLSGLPCLPSTDQVEVQLIKVQFYADVPSTQEVLQIRVQKS